MEEMEHGALRQDGFVGLTGQPGRSWQGWESDHEGRMGERVQSKGQCGDTGGELVGGKILALEMRWWQWGEWNSEFGAQKKRARKTLLVIRIQRETRGGAGSGPYSSLCKQCANKEKAQK